MFNIKKHKSLLVQILKDIYSDIKLSNSLGFKGGTALLLLYDLPRFSVDLDFNLICMENKEYVYEKVESILSKYGIIHDKADKHFGLLCVLDYGVDERKLKLDISNRSFGEEYEIKNYLGITLNVMKIEDMLANKLVAITDRKTLTTRDVFDCKYLMEQRIEINQNIVKKRTGFSLKDYFEKCISVVEKIPSNRVLFGLGELIEEELKKDIKQNLLKDFIFFCNLYKE